MAAAISPMDVHCARNADMTPFPFGICIEKELIAVFIFFRRSASSSLSTASVSFRFDISRSIV